MAEMIPNQFQAGLRILAVDDDNTVLEKIEKMCIRYKHHVTQCRDALRALNLVQERKDCFDVILIDVHVPNMDGFELLQRVKHEINVPVIMMSVDDATNAVMKSIKYEACDYWIKPLREDDFKCMWRHVARKVWSEDKLHESFVNLEDDNNKKSEGDDSEFNSDTDANATEVVDSERKNASREVEVDQSKNSCGHQTKKRVVWTRELHKKFVDAVTQLGNERAMPKRILEVMNEPDLSRENVASHLQKYRTYLKKPDGETSQQQKETVPRSMEPKLRGPGRLNLEASVSGVNANKENQTITYPLPLARCPPNIPHNFPQSIMNVHDASTTSCRPCRPSSSTLHYQPQKHYHQQPPLVHHQIHSFKSRMVLSANRASDTQALRSPHQSNNSLLVCDNLMTHGVVRSLNTVLLPVCGIQFPCDPRSADSIHHGSRSRDGNDPRGPTISILNEEEEPRDIDNQRKKKGSSSKNTPQ